MRAGCAVDGGKQKSVADPDAISGLPWQVVSRRRQRQRRRQRHAPPPPPPPKKKKAKQLRLSNSCDPYRQTPLTPGKPRPGPTAQLYIASHRITSFPAPGTGPLKPSLARARQPIEGKKGSWHPLPHFRALPSRFGCPLHERRGRCPSGGQLEAARAGRRGDGCAAGYSLHFQQSRGRGRVSDSSRLVPSSASRGLWLILRNELGPGRKRFVVLL
ncbi:hypothetical protein B0H67DRAFT_306922 [Lasiosphaeris hirsuta]|uniref:Uncharacterized protein n=1 Tax=Lasiosphaeris hirsuta TaxID=260670 RepID=A0AA40DNE9_9PEZI|nr:hypothetical protein B0H67DRAFT_306922 [Lasiosphaeris hirsuta]